MRQFTINRLTTNFGIFKLSGTWCDTTSFRCQIDSLEMMGTDGWFLLQNNNKTKILIDKLQLVLQQYLPEFER